MHERKLLFPGGVIGGTGNGESEGLIANIQDVLGQAVSSFCSGIDALTSNLLSAIKNPWQQFWVLPCIIAGVVLVLFLLTF